MGDIIKNKAINLLEQLLKTVEGLGIDETTKLLVSGTEDSLNLSDNRVDFVLKIVSVEFKIPIPEMINSYSKSTKRKFAIMFGVYYLHGNFGISFGDLSKLYQRDKGLLCRYFHEIKNLKNNDPSAKGLIKYRDKFDIMVSEYKISNNKN